MKLPLLFALAGTLCSVSWAQTDATPQLVPAPEAKERSYNVPIRNVKASLMAAWLDPMNYVYNRRLDPDTIPPRPYFDPKKDKAELPAGVSRIVAVDPVNALLVFATEEGAMALANTIRILDRPLRQVEIETRVYQVVSEEIQNLGLTFSATFPGPPFSRVKSGLNEKLDALVKRQKAILITAPRVVAINNATANLAYQNGRPATWDVKRAQGGLKPFANQEGFAALAQGTALQVVDNQSWKLTPTLNNDDTITLLTQGEQRLELQGNKGARKTDGAILLESQQIPQFTVNVRDGETIAVEAQTLPTAARPAATQTIVLLTPRIIRRAVDDDAVGATDIPVGIAN